MGSGVQGSAQGFKGSELRALGFGRFWVWSGRGHIIFRALASQATALTTLLELSRSA